MSTYSFPRTGTRPALALPILHKHGGRATIPVLMNLTEYFGQRGVFERDVAGSLVRYGLARFERDELVITAAGLEHLGFDPQGKRAVPLQVAGPRLAPSKAPLSRKNMPSVAMTRDGAFDYARHPSRVGDHRIEYTAKVCAA